MGKIFIPSKKYSKREAKIAFLERLRKEVKERQLIKVRFNDKNYIVKFGVEAPIITSYGKFQMIPAEVINGRWGKHYCLFYPNLQTLLKRKRVLLRIDSGCFSGMVLGDITCDCLEQLRISQKACIENKGGIVVEISGQDGRGWGEDNKMANQRLMYNLDITTAEAARIFYGNDENVDVRTYDECAMILKSFGFNGKHCFEMATNNPKKIEGLKKLGLNIYCSKSVTVSNPNSFVKKNLESKAKCWGHNFNNGSLTIKKEGKI